MDRIYIFLLHSLECVYYALLMAYLRATLAYSLRTLYEKKRAFTAITAVLTSPLSSSSLSYHQLLNLGDEKSNVAFIGEIARLVHKDIDFSLENNMPSSLPGTGSLSSSSPASISAMSVNEITALVGDKHIDGISNIYWAIIITIIIYAIVTTIKSIIIIGATYIEKLSVAFEEFETYFLAIFENRKRASVNSVYANIINAYQKQLNR